MTHKPIETALLKQLLTELQRMSNACELEGDKHGDGNKWHRLSDDATKAITAGRAAIDGAQRAGSTVKDCLTVPTNPNNCQYCEHSKNPQGGHCYMFRKAPTDICAKHTLANVSRGIGA